MSGCARSTLIAVSVVQTVAVVQAGERTALTDPSVAVSGTGNSGQGSIKSIRPNVSAMLDRIAYAVDGAESSHGEDPTMRLAAADVGGGDRFDSTENRAIGRAYLAQLYRRYKNWPDAIAAYNWGMGNVDGWVKAGRPADKFVIGVAAYLRRVLHDGGMCDGSTAAAVRPPGVRMLPANQHSRKVTAEEGEPGVDTFAPAVCADLDAWGRVLDERDRPLPGAQGHFYNKLERAMLLVTQHLRASQHATHGRDDRADVSWTIAMRRP